MPLVDEEFWWWKDPKGYKILKGKPDRPIDKEVTLDTPSLLNCIGTPDSIVPRSKPELYRISTDKHHEHYVHFANIKTEDAALDFCNLHGLPTDRPAFLPDILEKAQLFGSLIDAKRRGTLPIGIKAVVARIEVALFIDASGIMKLRADSATLLDFMFYQVIQDHNREIVARLCQSCGRYFRAGPGTDRRADSEYCTPEHQKEANEQRKARKKTARKLTPNQPTTQASQPNERKTTRKSTGLHAPHE